MRLARTLFATAVMVICMGLAVASDASAQPHVSVRPSPDYDLTPGGWVHRSCIHEVPDKSTLTDEGNGVIRVSSDRGVLLKRLRPCAFSRVRPDRGSRVESAPVPAIDGWVEWSQAVASGFPNGNWFNGMENYWAIPDKPSSYVGQTVFFFSAFQDSALSAIIQPVLQFGPSAAGGGNKWTVANWYISDSGTTVFSTLQNASAGERVFGWMSGFNCTTGGNCKWDIGICHWTGSGGPTNCTSLTTSAGSWVYTEADQGVLEVYDVTSCNHLPNALSTSFSDTYLYRPGAGGPNSKTDVATTIFWSGPVWGGTPNCSYGVNNFIRGTQLKY